MDSKLLILIAEDDPDDAFLIQHTLKKAELPNPTHIARDGADAIAYLKGEELYGDRQKFPFPRMLLLDLKMPRMSGLDVLRWVRAHPDCAVIPTIILSSSNDPEDVQEAYRLGANAYLVKRGLDGLENLMVCLHAFWKCAELPTLPVSCS
jgi:CheY-like chemotaxis protein